MTSYVLVSCVPTHNPASLVGDESKIRRNRRFPIQHGLPAPDAVAGTDAFYTDRLLASVELSQMEHEQEESEEVKELESRAGLSKSDSLPFCETTWPSAKKSEAEPGNYHTSLLMTSGKFRFFVIFESIFVFGYSQNNQIVLAKCITSC
ncbi:unnamed protein product [Protopolystoma xenopodis]|uniref:Uncharacterized protein n=1 Tax=Protopolystoma xenopodis TaxID=117903 RepID=A0A3S5B8C8_9PLAT|nr:unnamed protein product [Protopolystoma xenopodis]